MSLNQEQIQTNYPLPVYNYHVSVEGNGMSFSEITGLTIDYEKVEYRHGFSWLMGDNLIRARRNPANLTLKRGVIKDRYQLFEWLSSEEKKDIKIDLCDEKGAPLVSWQVLRAMPLKMELPSFNASSNDVALESLELIAHQVKIVSKDSPMITLGMAQLTGLIS